MELSTNRRLAAIILAVVICVFSGIGVNRSLSSLSSDIEKTFYDGVYNDGEGYLEKSVQSHLDNKVDAANGLITVDQSPGAPTVVEDLKEARYALMESKTIAEKYAADKLVTECSEKVYDALSAKELTDQQKKMLDYYITTIRGADNAISKLSYNEKVDEYYNKTLKSFPVSVFRFLISADGPEYFK